MKKTWNRKITTVILCMLMLTGCGEAKEANTANVSGDSEQSNIALPDYSKADLQESYPDVTELTLSSDTPTSITKGGAYSLSGTQKGQLSIDAQDEIVSLVLDNANLSSDNGPVILVESAAKLVITLPEGSENQIFDSAYYENFWDQEASIFSYSDVTINGSGSLFITGYAKDAIRCKGILKVRGCHVEATAKRNSIRANDGFMAENAELVLQGEKNGLLTTKSNDTGAGFVSLRSCDLHIVAGEYGITAAGDVEIQDCNADIYGILGHIECGGRMYLQEGITP